jgi:arylsulfatase
MHHSNLHFHSFNNQWISLKKPLSQWLKIGSLFFLFPTLFLISCQNSESTSSINNESKPNILFIMADDLGYGELGCFGQEKIETPHIDALAKSGKKFTQFYTGAPVCAPARCILLTGKHAGNAHVRGNDEWKARGKVWDYEAMWNNPFLEGQRTLPDSIVTVGEILQDADYQTAIIGKWGLGAPTTEGVPNKQGFDFFYGYNCQRQAHTLYPMHLWRNDEKDTLNNKMVAPHSNLAEGADPNDPASYADFELNDYAPEKMHQEALQFMDANKDKPFFLYYASPLPHLPLQAPKRWVEHYQKKFGEEEPYTGKSYFPNRTPHATYAAMISYLDEQVGDLVAKLKELGIYENTLILFTSDNGPTYTGGADTPFFDSAKPFKTEYGWGKGFTHEGGIRVPMIASWPSKIEPNTESNHPAIFYDVMATFCDILDIDAPENDGISFLPAMLDQPQEKHEFLYWEFPAYKGQQAVRMGKWKGIRKNILEGNLKMELYDLENDIQEQNNVADTHPEIVKRIEEIMLQEHTEATIERFKMEALGDVKDEKS